ncbi:pumilio homolog 3-like isoform X2 [Acanthaster planci]|uniref:Pumilio homolog 3-like isoform X2 n=1 Tax=Acanthaster planci TaxID=133434 RepID=A0A8B7YWR4_ACAPL|nr:pumilio homolog 3-like isoform X2 [Acanthaster planci]
MAKPKMKSVSSPKVASYPSKTTVSKKVGKQSRPGGKQGGKLPKQSGGLKKAKKLQTEKAPSDKENPSERFRRKKAFKFSSSGSKAAAKKQGVKRKSPSDEKDEEGDTKRPKLEELSFKDRKLERRKLKSNYELTQRAKTIWNTVREKNCSKEKRSKLLTELCGLIQGKVFELLSAHDTVRVIQCCLQFGSDKQRQEIFDEVKDAEKILLLAKGKYSKHFVMKMLRYGKKEHRSYIMTCFHGQVSKLVRHREAAEVLELAYNYHANAKQRSALLEEFYSPRFAIFKEEGTHTLEDILEKEPDKKQGIMEHMLKMLSQVIEKSVVKHSIVHKALLDFLVHAPAKMKTELIEGMRDVVVHILHTHDGARAAMHCLWFGTAKDRKAIIKSFKTFVVKICKEEFGHLVLLALFDCVDDTLLVRKVIIDEMMKSISEVAEDQYGRKVLLYLLSPRNSTHFHPQIVEILRKGDGNPASKKETELRRKELLAAASDHLLSFVSENAKELTCSKSSCLLLLAVLTHAKGDKVGGYQAIASLAAEEFIPALASDEESQLNEVHIIEHPAGHLVIRKLLQHQKTTLENAAGGGEIERLFSDVFLDAVDQNSLQAWTRANRGALVLASLLDCGQTKSRQRVISALKPIMSHLVKINTKGMEVLMEKLQQEK